MGRLGDGVEIEVIIVNTTDDNLIEVKLDEDTYALFHKNLFSKSDDIFVGQHFKYQINVDSEGYRYQHFKPFIPQIQEKDNESILNILENFKYKG
jgi:hypothetical protein